MAQLIVDIADCKVTANREDELISYALGSCIGLAIHDPVAGVGGLLHILLPDSRLLPAEASRNPFKFADTGIPELFHQAYRLGADKRRLHVYLVGGSAISDQSGVFAVGAKNITAARKILWRAGVFVHGESTGGGVSRTVRLAVKTGDVYLRIPGEPESLLARAPGGVTGAIVCVS